MTIVTPALLKPRFIGAATSEKDKNKIAAASILKAKDKEARVLSFYQDPYGDGSVQWHLERILWNYLREFKVIGKKRKDGVTESITHELDQILNAAVFFKTGYLPNEVTYQISRGTKLELPPEQRPIENLFSMFPIHDRDEEDPSASRDTLIEYANDGISDLQGINDSDKDFMRLRTNFIADGSDAITFGRKTLNDKGEIIKEITHQGNLDVYMSAMQEIWAAIACKSFDGVDGTIKRFSRVKAKGITPNRTKAFLDEKIRLYMIAQPLEDMQMRYPQLAPFFEIMNARLRVAVVSTQALIQHHPELSRKHFKPRDRLDPNTAVISLRRSLETSMCLAPWTSRDICEMTCMLEGMIAEAQRYPALEPIVNSIHKELFPYLKQLESAFDIKEAPTLRM